MMNKTIEPADISNSNFKDKAKTIGLLDIFGFENFASNNYEQLCINYVNEKLHKLYIAAIFEAECVELREEGLGFMVESIQYPDLKVLDILRLLDYKKGSAKYAGIKYTPDPPSGMFTMIDDKCTSYLQGKEVPYAEVLLLMEQSFAKTQLIFKQENAREKHLFTIFHSA